MRVWIYVRVSARDAAEEAGRSARRLAERAGSLGLELERVFVDRSELDDRRPERERMLELLATEEPPGALMVERLAALWRPAEAVEGWRSLASAGVAIVSEADRLDTRGVEAAAHARAIVEALARLAREHRGERVALGIHLARTRKPGELAAWGGGRTRRVLPFECLAGWYEAGVSEAEMRRRLGRQGVRAGARAISRALDELWAAGQLSEEPARRRRRYARGGWRDASA